MTLLTTKVTKVIICYFNFYNLFIGITIVNITLDVEV